MKDKKENEEKERERIRKATLYCTTRVLPANN